MLVVALFEWDHQPLKWTFALFVGLVFFLVTAVYLPLQPIPILEHLPGLSLSLSPWVAQALKLVVGAVMGTLVGRLMASLVSRNNPSLLTYSFFLTGLVLGWQALLQVSLLFAILLIIVRFSTKLKNFLQGRTTPVLLAAIAIHHPLWKIIADAWRFN